MNTIEEIGKSRCPNTEEAFFHFSDEDIFVEGFKSGLDYCRFADDLRVATFSNKGKWDTPVLDIQGEEILYTSLSKGAYGIQLSERLSPIEDEIVALCNEIADKMYKLNTLIRK